MLKHISAFMTFYSPVQNLLTAPFSPSPLRSRRVAAPRSAPAQRGDLLAGGSFAPGQVVGQNRQSVLSGGCD